MDLVEDFVGTPNSRDEKAHDHVANVLASSAARALVGSEQSAWVSKASATILIFPGAHLESSDDDFISVTLHRGIR